MGNKLDKVTPLLDEAERCGFTLDLSGKKVVGQALKAEDHLMPIPVAKRLKHFRKVNLNKTQLHALPHQILHMSSLASLLLDDNKLSTLPRELGMMKSLWLLSVCHNRVSSIPPELSQLKNLKKLMLHKNQLSKLPDLSGLESLTHLYLGGNKFTQLPDSVFQLTTLEELHAQENALIQVVGLGRLPKLRVINLRSNKVQILCEDIGECENLEELHLWNNSIRGLPVELSKCTELRQLYVQTNLIGDVPCELTALSNLENVDFSGNPLRGKVKKLKNVVDGQDFLDRMTSWFPPTDATTPRKTSEKGKEVRRPSKDKDSGPDVMKMSEIASMGLRARTQTGTFLGKGHSFNVLQYAVEALGWIWALLTLEDDEPSEPPMHVYKIGYIADGAVLCAALNKIDEDLVPNAVYPEKAELTKEEAAQNVNGVISAMKELGVPKEVLFTPSALLSSTDIPSIHNAILCLGRVIQSQYDNVPEAMPVPDNYPFTTEQVVYAVEILKLKESRKVATATVSQHGGGAYIKGDNADSSNERPTTLTTSREASDDDEKPKEKKKSKRERQVSVILPKGLSAPEWLRAANVNEDMIEDSLTWSDLCDLEKTDWQDAFGKLKGAALYRKFKAIEDDLDLGIESTRSEEKEEKPVITSSDIGKMRNRVAAVRESHAWRACPEEWLEDGWEFQPADIKLEREVGSGSFGNVYSASYHGVKVAVKEITPRPGMSPKAVREMMELMRREADILKSLSHPNVLQFIGSFESRDDVFYIVTELVANPGEYEDLRDMLDDKVDGMDWRVVNKFASDMARGMAYLHSHNVIHRDLKSENILIDAVRAVVCDFGFAKVLDAAVNDASAKHMTLCGSEGCMSPELMMGNPYSYGADVFPYGLILWEMCTLLTGVDPVWRRYPQHQFALDIPAVEAHVREGCPPLLVELAKECCEVDPNKRPSFTQIVFRLGRAQVRPSMKSKLDQVIDSLVESEVQQDIESSISSLLVEGTTGDPEHDTRMMNRVVGGMLDEFFKEEITMT